MSWDVAQIVYDRLSEHFRRAREEGVPRELAFYPHGYLISYSELTKRTRIPLDPRQAGGPLYHVATFCQRNHLKCLHALVVRKDEPGPGKGFFGAAGTEAEDLPWSEQFQLWRHWAEECIEERLSAQSSP